MQIQESFKQLLRTKKRSAILTHFKPDADALGSSLGWAAFLKKKNHEVQVVTPSDFPEFLNWLPDANQVFIHHHTNKETLTTATTFIEQADIIFCLDFSDENRIYELTPALQKSKATKVVIDHHLEPKHFSDYLIWDDQSASTAGLIYELIVQLGETEQIDSPIATCLYAGLMADTGGFRHSNTRSREFEIAAHLVQLGANPHYIYRQIFETNSIERIQMLGYVLKEKLIVLPEYNTAYIALSSNDLRKYNAKVGDTEGFVNLGLSIQGVVFAVFFYERKNEIKLSFRSSGNFSVNQFAQNHFNGGGHFNAAGGSSELSLDDTIRKFLNLLPTYKQQLNQ